MKTVAIIPARSGSKSVKDKNIQSLHGKPLIQYSIDHALQSKLIDRVIVSTDNDQYMDLARSLGAETPFKRPAAISQDHSTDLEAFQHALSYLKVEENYEADICVHLRPTCPYRDVTDIDKMIKILMEDPKIDSVRSVVLSEKTPYKMWFMNASGELEPILKHEKYKEAYNMPRQILTPSYTQTASIDVIRTSTITEKNSMTGEIIHGYKLDTFIDIDTYQDFDRATNKFDIDRVRDKKFVFDIDGVIAHLSPANDYNLSKPNKLMIEKINQLYTQDNYIVLFTARGYVTGIDWRKVTENQMRTWGVKHHELHLGKPNADYYVDDKNLLISQILK